MNDEILRLQNLFIAKENHTRMSHLNLSLTRGESLGLFGLYDSGKTTLFDTITGKIDFESGFFYCNDIPYTDNRTGLKNLKVARISTQPALFEGLTLWENILVLRRRRHLPFALKRNFIRKEVEDKINFFNLKLNSDELAKNLSASQRFLIELLRAYFSNVDIVLVDDFSLDLKPDELESLNDFIQKMKNEGVSFIFASRKISLLRKYSDRIAFISSGTIIKTIENKKYTSLEINSILSSIYADDLGKTKVQHRSDSIVFKGGNLNIGMERKSEISFRQGEITALIDPFKTEAQKIENQLQDDITNGRICYSGNVGKKNGWKGKVIYTDFNPADNVFNSLSVANNLCFPFFSKFSSFGFIRTGLRDYAAGEFISWLNNEEFAIKKSSSSLTQRERTAIHLFRLRLANPGVVICRDPWSATDYASVKMIYRELFELTRQFNTAVLLILTNLDELEDFADRYIVITGDNNLTEVPFSDLRKTAFSYSQAESRNGYNK